MNEIALRQGTIRYLDMGDGPPVVFVHGLFVDHELWSPVVDQLCESHRCIAPDWPLGSHTQPMNRDADLSPAGMAQLVADFIKALELKDVTLVGNDSGGVICQLVVADHSDCVGRLVLTNCDALEVFPPPGFEYISLVPRIPGALFALSRAMYHIPSLRRSRTAFGALTKQPLSEGLLEKWVTPTAKNRGIRRDTAKFGRGATNKVSLGVADRLTNFPGPALLLWGVDDPFFTIELAGRLKDRFNDARVEPIAEATVFSPLDQPARVADGIARFAAERAEQMKSQEGVATNSPG